METLAALSRHRTCLCFAKYIREYNWEAPIHRIVLPPSAFPNCQSWLADISFGFVLVPFFSKPRVLMADEVL